jgi:hypothetical protein
MGVWNDWCLGSVNGRTTGHEAKGNRAPGSNNKNSKPPMAKERKTGSKV